MKICEDSEIIYDIFSENEKTNITKNKLLEEIEFHQMSSQQTLVPRLIAIQGEITNGYSPLYRHPADEQPVLKPFTPTTKLILDKLNKMLNLNMNHVLIQFYRNGEDNIGEHSDKTLDILKFSPIVNYTIGETRTLRLRNKNTKQKEYIELKDNSLFILGPETNKKWLHGIKSNSLIKDSRISFTFRTIATFINESGEITGQGAPVNSYQTLDSLDMLKAFSKENHESNFNWNEHYGKGFRALNFKFMDR
jgi:alkylated DNA repair dioxygenase AlkB